MSLYDHRKLESKWRSLWDAELKAGTSNWLFDEERGLRGDKQYLLDMFPYPSGSGLHVGHVEEKAAIDILARYLRMRGENVLMPTGYDSFGLPTENYAIKNDLTPDAATKQNTQNFHEQTKNIGISYDWSRELATSDPEYYKFTQWWFKFLYERGLAYRKKQSVNWCPVDQTVLANEQVIDGRCERCDSEVVQKDLEQWFFKITDYAERLLADLEKLDWPESTKAGQRNWIGKSEGALIDFLIPKYKKVLVATNNSEKIERLRKVVQSYGLGIELLTPKEAGLQAVAIEEGDDITANARLKAESYRSQTNLPILGLDTAFEIPTHPELVAARVKRNALGDLNEADLSQQEIANLMREYYQGLVRESGKEQLDAQFVDALALSLPNGQVETFTGNRPVNLVNSLSAAAENIVVPLNAVAISKKLNKYVSELDVNEELSYIQETTNAFINAVCERVTVFSTRVDTIYGATYVVLAPEHKLAKHLATSDQQKAVEAYIAQASSKTELQRTALEKDKTGVFTGSYAINPLTKKQIPIWIGDYVLNTYGTGAVMAVPAHDERDFSFAIKYQLPIAPVVMQPQGNHFIAYATTSFLNDFEDFMAGLSKFKPNYISKQPEKVLFTIDGEQLDDFANYARNFIKENAWLDLVGDKHVALFANGERIETPKFEHNGQLLAKLKSIEPSIAKHEHLWGMLFDSPYQDYVCYTGEGVLINSAEASGLTTQEARGEFVHLLEERGLGKLQINYKLRDWSISRQRFWGSPIPIVYRELSKAEQERQKLFNKLPELVLDVHALNSAPAQAYHTWLASSLQSLNINVSTPQLPGGENPILSEWLSQLDQQISDLTSKAEDPRNLVITGRSLGAWAVLKLAESTPLRKLVLVAPLTPAALSGPHINPKAKKKDAMTPDLAANLKSILGDAILNFEAIKQNIGEIVVFLGNDDGYIPATETTAWFKENLPKARVIQLRGAGHFTAELGYSQFKELLTEILAPVRLDIAAVEESELPVLLPDDVDYRPKGTAPLGTSVKFNSGLEEKYGKGSYREIDTMDTFVCSSWYFFRFLDPNNNSEFASESKLRKLGPVDFYIGGAEHTVLHLLYSRFFTKVAYDAGLIDYDEPFLKLRHQGLILGPDNRKMSKRWGNVINPTDIVEAYGADTLRMYEMFMGPLDQMKSWSEGGVKGIRRFLQRIWDAHQQILASGDVAEDKQSQTVLRFLNGLIAKVSSDIENLKFNTAVSEFMKFINLLQEENFAISAQSWGKFLQTLYPFAPFLTSELWEQLAIAEKIDKTWPEPVQVEDNFVELIKIAVTVNGKLRDNIEVHKSTQQDEALQIAMKSTKVTKYVADKSMIRKVIFVPGKLLNLVV